MTGKLIPCKSAFNPYARMSMEDMARGGLCWTEDVKATVCMFPNCSCKEVVQVRKREKETKVL